MRLRVRESIRSLAAYYRSGAKLVTVLLVAATIVLPFINAATPTPPSLQVNISNINSFKCNSLGFSLSGLSSTSYNATISVSGQYSGDVIFNGTGQLVGTQYFPSNAEVINFTFGGGNYKPSPLTYPSSKNVTLSQAVSYELINNFNCSNGVDVSLDVYAYSGDGKTLLGKSGTVNGGPGGYSDIYVKAVALPLINDSMLGAPFDTNSSMSAQAAAGQYYIPGLGDLYNYISVFALILLGVGFMVGASAGSLVSKEEDSSMESQLLKLFLGVVFVLLFPLIYDQVAVIVNYMSQSIIAYPGTDYGPRLQALWNTMAFGGSGSFWSVITAGFYNLIFFVLSAIVYIMLFFLGVIRIFLIGVMIVAFPLSLGLKMIPFTKKLSQMVEDTLFGLILASLMSAIILGVAGYITQPSVWSSSSNIFYVAVGNDGADWVAAAALLAAVLIPTVFAPLTGTLFQTASQAAMTSVGAATVAAAGAAMPVAGAVGAPVGGIANAVSGVGSAAGSVGGGGGGGNGGAGTGSSMANLSSRLMYAAPAVARNVLLATATGALAAGGARESAKVLGRIAPMQTHHEIRASIAQKQMNEVQGQNFTQALTPVQNKIDQHMTLQAFNKLPDEAKSSFSMADAQKKHANALENPNEILGSLSPGGTQGRTLSSPGNAAVAEGVVRAKLEGLDRSNEEHMKAFYALQRHVESQEKGTRQGTRR